MTALANRALERHRSALVRAIGGDATAELRGTQLRSHGQPVRVASPYLALDLSGFDDVRVAAASRGIGDALGLLLRHSDIALHGELAPVPMLERVIFDVLEQLRCEALAPPLPGLRANLDAAFAAWCLNARATRVAESGVGLLVYTLTHMSRTRLFGGYPDEEVDAIIEATRFTLASLVGHALQVLPSLTHDQRSFAEAAREMARLVAELAGDAAELEASDGGERYRMLVPIDWLDGSEILHETTTGDLATASRTGNKTATSLDALPGYHVFTRAHDVEITADLLYRAEVRKQLRRRLDELHEAQAVSPHRLARRFQRLFGAPAIDDWQFGQDDGIIDARRLTQLVTSSGSPNVFRRPRTVVRSETAVTFLMDNSGSMKVQRYEALAVLVDTMSRALDLAGVTNEVLGFTTASWSGGRARAEWLAAGRPAEPGRLADAMHLVYKDAEAPWRQARASLATMLKPQHFREGLDGEAIVWAHNRLLARPEPRKVLVIISDGAPSEASTANANRPGFLATHLTQVVDHIERRSAVEIAAFTLDADVGSVFRRSVPINLDGTLTIGTYGGLELLFRPR